MSPGWLAALNLMFGAFGLFRDAALDWEREQGQGGP
jgi:hypothetical protein